MPAARALPRALPRTFLRALPRIFSLPLLAGPALVAALLPAAPARAGMEAAPADRLGPGDSVRVQVFQNPELGTEARLSSRGEIVLPLAGAVALEGLTLDEAAERIAGQYRTAQLLKAPQVNVTLVQMRSRQVAVLGQVARPGRYALDEGRLRLSDVIAQAAPEARETVKCGCRARVARGRAPEPWSCRGSRRSGTSRAARRPARRRP